MNPASPLLYPLVRPVCRWMGRRKGWTERETLMRFGWKDAMERLDRA